VRLEADDIAEDRAAAELATALVAGDCGWIPPSPAAQSLAKSDGVFVPDVARIGLINHVNEDLPLATLAAYTPVKAGQMVATVKIIPFAVKRPDLERCVALAREAPALALAPYRHAAWR